MRMSSYSAGLAVLLSAAWAVSPAHAATITFNADVACQPGNCTSAQFISQGYDAPGLNLSYRGVTTPGNNATGVSSLSFWKSGVSAYSYGDLDEVVYVGVGAQAGEVRFDVLNGSVLTLNSVQLAGGQNVDRGSQVSIYDLAYNLLFSSAVVASGSTHTTVNFGGVSSQTGLILQFGPDGYDVAIDNIEYSLQSGGVPEPDSWALAIAGFGLAGFAARRRRHRQPAAA